MPICRHRAMLVRAAVLSLASLSLAACDVSVGDGGFSVGLTAGKATDEWTRSYQLEAGGRVEIVNVNGRINVEAVDGTTVEVRAVRTAKAATDEGARELLKKIEMHEDVQPGRVRIETRPPGHLIGMSQEVQYTLRIPRSAHVELENVNGPLSVKGVRGGVRAINTNGQITGESLAGGVEARTTNGAVRLQLDSIGRDAIRAETVNGRIDVEMPGSARADISARSVNGGIHVSGLELQDIGERTRRSLDARLNGGGGRIDVETTNGGIQLVGKS